MSSPIQVAHNPSLVLIVNIAILVRISMHVYPMILQSTLLFERSGLVASRCNQEQM